MSNLPPPPDGYEPPEFVDDPKVLSEISKFSMRQRSDDTNKTYLKRVSQVPLCRYYYFGPHVGVPSQKDPPRVVMRNKYSLQLRGISTDLTFQLVVTNRVTGEVLKEEERTSMTREIMSKIIEYFLETDS